MFDTQIKRIKTKLQELHIDFEQDFQPILTLPKIQEFERKYQITLPPEYVAFLTQIGNGGLGPYLEGVGLKKLEDTIWEDLKPHLTFPYTKAKKVVYEDEQTEKDLKELTQFYHLPENNQGHLVISDFGCGIFAILIVKGDAYGQVWMDQRESEWGGFYPSDINDDSILEIVNPPLHFLDWYEKWLDSKMKDNKF